jgi:hypothetical protein
MYHLSRVSAPTIFKAFETIELDSGELTSFLDKNNRKRYNVPDHWVPHLVRIEWALRELPPSELETLCVGEDSEQRLIKFRSMELHMAYCFLADFFDGWVS